MNYQIIYSIVQTNCSKEDFPSLREDCVPLPNGVSSRHLAIVFHTLLTAFPECQALGLDTEMSFSGSHSCSPGVLGPELLVRQSMCVTLSISVLSGIRMGFAMLMGCHTLLSSSSAFLCVPYSHRMLCVPASSYKLSCGVCSPSLFSCRSNECILGILSLCA